jgi:NAD(P)H dehydrogenase (quinone)
VPEPFARALADSDVGASRGELDDRSGDLHRLLGRKTTPLEQVIQAALSAR